MTHDTAFDLRIDRDRLMQSLAELAKVGAFHDEQLDLDGVRRVALTEADGDGRRLVREWFQAEGLDVVVDKIGNVYGIRAGTEPELAPVLLGSHIDTVPSGGAFDGALGVMGALEVVRTLNEHRIATRRSVAIGFFTDEEGCRFGSDMLGSAVAVGRHTVEDAYSLCDADGATIGQELARIGFKGDADPTAMRPHAYVECHIEQGPILAAEGIDVGVVTGVQAICWHELDITGRAAHAGTTPIEYRRDAGLAAARINVQMRDLVESGRFGKGMRATMGVVRTFPGAVNVVPSRAVATVDLRNPDTQALADAEHELIERYNAIAGQLDVTIDWCRTARTSAVAFDDEVQAIIAGHATALGLSHRPILSGAGHDAQEWASIAKAGMIFVPGEHDGISHNPRELSTPESCANGVDVLLRTLISLADS